MPLGRTNGQESSTRSVKKDCLSASDRTKAQHLEGRSTK